MCIIPYTSAEQTPDEFNVVDLPLLGATYQLGQTLRDFQNLVRMLKTFF